MLIIFSFIVYIYYSIIYHPFYITQIVTPLRPEPTAAPTATPTPAPSSTAVPTPTPAPAPTPAPPTPTPDPLRDEIVSHTPISNIRGIIILPYKVEKGRSIGVNVTLVSSRNIQFILTVTPEKYFTERIEVLGTPDVSIIDSYGPEYSEVFAVAQLSGPAFTIEPKTEQMQSLDLKKVSFGWSVLANEVGPQTLEMSIKGQWKSIIRGGDVIERPIIQKQLSIQVDNGPLLLSPGQINIGELLMLLIGSVLNIPWILDYIQKRQEAKGKNKLSSSSQPRKKKTRHH